jgi:HemY protein
MLWSLIKILAFVAVITALTFGATQLMNVDGGAVIQIAGYEIALGALELVFALIALIVLVWLGLRVLAFCAAAFRFLNGDETAISRYFDRNRERKGYEALSEGMMALASGEGHLALTKATRAEKYLNKPTLTTLLTAQAAEMTGDRKKAEASYKKLLGEDKTRFVGVRGIMKQKLQDGDTDTALTLAKKAFALRPKHEDTQDVLLKLQAEKSDWAGARDTLNAKLKSGAIPRDVHKRRDAVLALSEARGNADTDDEKAAREAAIEANRLSPDLIPAAIHAARGYIADGNARYAARVLSKAWSTQPHPELASTFAEIAPDETPTDRIKRFRALTKLNPQHPETKMLLAELHIAAEDFPAARRDIAALVEEDPTARALTIMAAVERGEGADDAIVRDWLTRALIAPRGPQWVCDNCQHIHSGWVPICDHCQSFDTLSWARPPEDEGAMPKGAQMLPLIVGQPTAPIEPLDKETPAEPELIDVTDPAEEEKATS